MSESVREEFEEGVREGGRVGDEWECEDGVRVGGRVGDE